MNRLLIALTVGIGTFLSSPQSGSSNDDDANPVQVVKLIVSAAPEPTPALRYQLLPSYWERQPGNSAPFYFRAVLLQKSIPRETTQKLGEKYDAWLAWPLTDDRKQEINEYLQSFSTVFKELHTAVYREDCEWDYRLKDIQGEEIVYFRIDEVQESRSIAQALRLKARVAISEGRYEDALESIRSGMKLARDLAKVPILINNLVGIAIGNMMLDELQRLSEAPGAPNFYWALASLPQPMFSQYEALQQEMGMPEQLMPLLKDAETADHSAAEWQLLLDEAVATLARVSDSASMVGDAGSTPSALFSSKLRFTGLVLVRYPGAKDDLIASGMSRDVVEAMPVAQVIAIQTARAHRINRDNFFKWSNLPYSEISDRASAEIGRLQASFDKEIIPLSRVLLPALFNARRAEVRFNRRLATVQAIEAIRMHVSVNNGSLPASLKEISVVPVLRDPAMDQPFGYHVEGDVAILEVAALPGGYPNEDAKRFEIRIQK